MNNEYDISLVEAVYDAFKGLEVIPNIKILGYEFDDSEFHYDPNDHLIKRNTNKNKLIKSMAETRCGIMYLDVQIFGLNKEGNHEVHYLKRPIIIPIIDKDGYMYIRGKKCYLIYQMVDKMLYPSFGAVTIKSLMPIYIKTTKEEMTSLPNIGNEEIRVKQGKVTDVTGETFIIPIYHIQIFKSTINVLMIYSHLGITKTLNFLEVHRFIKVFDKNQPYPIKDDYLYFECGKKSDIIVAVIKEVFDKEIYVKSMTGCLIKLLEETKIKYEDIDNWEEWMLLAGGKTTVRKGQFQHLFFNRLLDPVTAKELKINKYDKQNIYYLLKWALQNFHTLWSKDNLSMINKRLRRNEYIVTFITADLSRRINHVALLGDRATIRDFLNIFKFQRDFLILKMRSSGVMRYSETNSDIDFPSKFKLTKKGPNDTRTYRLLNKLGPINFFNCVKFLLSSHYCNQW